MVGRRILLVTIITKTLIFFSHSSDGDIQLMGRGVGNNGGNLGFETRGFRGEDDVGLI